MRAVAGTEISQDRHVTSLTYGSRKNYLGLS